MGKHEYLDEMLNGYLIEEDVLKKILNTGIPHKYRPVVYKVIFGILSRNTSLHKNQENMHIKRYKSFFKLKNIKYSEFDTESFNENNQSKNILSFTISKVIINQIQIDIDRIKIEHRFYNNIDYSFIYKNILIITAAQRPLTEYIQGMGDLIIPFFHLFIKDTTARESNLIGLECSIFQCFQKVIVQIELNLQSMQFSSFVEILKILKFFDEELFLYFEIQEIDIAMFGSRWLHCIFIREFSLDFWFRIFDSMVCTDIPKFLVFFSVSLLRLLRYELLSLDSCEAIVLLQNIREMNIILKDIEHMVGEVNYMRNVYQE